MAIEKKKWIEIKDRRETDYVRRVNDFLKFAFDRSAVNGQIKCPCRKCRNMAYRHRPEVRFHLINDGFLQSYTVWYFRGEGTLDSATEDTYDDGEAEPELDDVVGLINDIYRTSNVNEGRNEDQSSNLNSHQSVDVDDPNPDAALFYRLLSEAKQKVHPTCEQSKFGAIVKLQSYHRWTNASFDGLLELLLYLIPNGKEALPATYRDARSYIRDLGLHYEKYDVSVNNCTLYWSPDADATSYQVCGLSRWKSSEELITGKPVPHKVLRYFPIIPRLQRLFMSTRTTSYMRWHKEKRGEDVDLHHPADSPAWKHFDSNTSHLPVMHKMLDLALRLMGFSHSGT